MYLIDYHMHTEVSADSHAKLKDLVKMAYEQGINEIAITDHFDPLSYEDLHKNYKPGLQIETIERIRTEYQDKMTILHGVEYGELHQNPLVTKRILEEVPFDYVLGSVHKESDAFDIGLIKYTTSNVAEIVARYLKEVRKMVVDNQFDCVAHIDLVKRYANRQGVSFDIMDFKPILCEIFELLVQNDKGIEINTSGVRQGMGLMMPELDVVTLYKQMGGQIITVGSDSHHHNHVGADIKNALEMIKAAGFNSVTTFRKRVPNQVGI